MAERFEPFDTGLVVHRLEQAVPALQTVGGAADYAAVKELRGFRTPSAFVIFAEDSNTGKVPDALGVCAQEALVQFAVVLALRNYREQRGDQMAAQARELVGLVRGALIGWRPPQHAGGKGVRVLGWRSGSVLDYDASVLLFADLYQTHYVMERGGGAA